MFATRIGSKILAALAGIGLVGAAVVAVPTAAQAAPSTETVTFSYTGGLQSFTVPAGITQLTITATGAEGGLGGRDSQGEPIPGGYKGRVTGTIDVTPGQVISVSVGGGGSRGASSTSAQSRASAGYSPLSGYSGGQGGMPGNRGSSGGGGGGGAATVLVVGDNKIVAGGAGGGGGSGQWEPLVGRQAEASHSPRTDTTSTTGQNGYDVMLVCNNNCDGGGSGAGGGGAQGGKQGTVEFGTGTYTEWLGYGGFPGSNSTGGLAGLNTNYVFFSGNSGNGSVVISYSTGSADAPLNVIGSAGNQQVELTWTAPTNTGGAAITDYIVQYAVSGSTPTWTTFADGTSASTSATVTGLTNGTSYIFRVAAVNSFGTGTTSPASDIVRPSGVPAAPSITAITPGDARLSVAFTPGDTVSPVLRYEYQLDGGAWVQASGTSSPLTITGLTNGASYAVSLRAINAIGTGEESAPLSATPMSTPGAPSIDEVTPGIRSAAISFTPGFTGGGSLTAYEYRLGSGSWVTLPDTSSPLTITGLADGTTYAVQIRAVNAAGAGSASTVVSLTTLATPTAPAISAITADDRRLTIAVTPAATGGSAITSYEYQLETGGDWTSVPASSPIIVSGLVNGIAYDVRVRAVNAVGTGAASLAVSATPATTPGAPAIVGDTISGVDGTLETEFTAPIHAGGSPITTYEYSTDGGATWRVRETGTTASPLVITTLSSDGTTALTGGQTYYVEVRAVNAMGAGTASGVAAGITRTAPDAPTITSLTPTSGALHVQFAPGANGGSAVTRYEYRIGSGAWTTTGSLGSTFQLDGLENGTEYSVQVRAVNAEGEGAASAAVSETPRDLPAQASLDSFLPTHQTLTVRVSVPTDGGSPVTGWEYTTDGGLTWATASSTTSPLIISKLSSDSSASLVNGASYSIAVRAVNAAGAGPASDIRVLSPRAVPAEPVIVVTEGVSSLSVAYTVADDGGSPVTAIEYNIGGSWIDAGSLSSPFVISGLANGTTYPVTVRAVNVSGASGVNAARSGTPRTVPDAPTTVTAASDDVSTLVSWTPPAFNGGSPITSYVATAYTTAGGDSVVRTATTASTSATITPLKNGTTYYVSVTAINAAGESVASSPRVAVTPLAKPGAPVIGSIVAANTYLTVPFTAPSAGSMPITAYQYRLNGGSWVNAGTTSSPVTISSLTNGVEYSVQLRAVSSAGAGPASAAVAKTPFTLPDAPDAATIVAEPISGGANVTWVAPNANGSTITGYTIVAWSAATQGSQSRTCTSTGATSCQITGLSNGTTYYITIDATNAAGTSTRSTPRVPVVYTGAPGRVTGVSGTSGDAKVDLTWTAPAANASAITDYTLWYKSSTDSSYTRFTDAVSSATSGSVTGLTNGTAYTFIVYAVNSNGTSIASAASTAVTPIGPGVAPTFGTPVRTADGFTVEITNYEASTNYTPTVTNGATASVSGSTVTVSGLAPTAPSTLTLAAARFGYTIASADVSGSALAAGEKPTLGTTTSIDYGFTFEITNYDVSATYVITVPGGTGAVADNLVTVSGLPTDTTVTVEVTATREGRTDATESITGSSLPSAPAPIFGTPVQGVDSFTVTIDNLDSSFAYLVSTTAGGITFTGSTITISGLAPGESADVTVSVERAGFTTAGGVLTSNALIPGIAPTLLAGPSTLDGFTFSINDPAGAGYVVSTTAGSISLVGNVGVVTGLGAGGIATVTVTAVRGGYTDASSTILSTAIPSGTLPAAGAPTYLTDGFSFEIDNFDVDTVYTVTTSAGVVALSGSTVIVSGLAPGESATVTIVATKADVADAVTTVTGASITPGVAPSLGGASTIDGGFTFTIADYDPAFSYTFTGTNGAVFSQSGAIVTVTGLAPSTTSDVTVTKSRPGHTDSVSYVSGTSAVAPPPPPPAPAAPSSASSSGSGSTGSGSTGSAATEAGASAPSSPAPPKAPKITHLSPGESGAKIGSTPINFVITFDGTAATGSAGGMNVSIQPERGPKPGWVPSTSSHLTVEQGGALNVTVSGFLSGTELDVWGFSTAQLLSQGVVGADSTAISTFPIPASMKPGPHTLVIVGTAVDGQPFEATVGFTIQGDERDALARAGVSIADGLVVPPLVWWLIGMLVVAGTLAIIATARMRRITKY